MSASKVKETMESILKKVRDTTEAPKTDYLGYLTVNVFYDEVKCQRLFRPKIRKVKTSFFAEIP